MKHLIILLFACLTLQGSIPMACAEQVLKGEVLLVLPTGATEPAGLVSVVLAGTGKATETDDLGQFIFDLLPHLTFGKTLTFRVQTDIKKQSWRIWDPIDGKLSLPRSLFATIKLLPQGSKKFWTDQFIEYHIAKIAEEAKREVKPTADTSLDEPKINFGVLIKEWATEYGFTPQEAKRQIDQWVLEVKEKQEDFYKLGLAAYAEQEFAKAAELFNTYANRHAEEYKRLVKEAEPHREKAIQGYRKAGDSLYSHYQFEKALQEYEQALNFIKKEDELELWTDVQMDIAGANWAIGTQTMGQKMNVHLSKARQAYSQAEEKYAALGQKERQARAQVGLGSVLNDVGIRTGGEEGQQLLAQAVTAYRAALEVRTKESLAPHWAQTHNNLAEAAMALGDWEQVVTSYRNVLELYPDYADAYLNTNAVLHEKLFRFAEAFSLNEKWLKTHPDDEPANMNFAEVHLTTGRFEEAGQRFAKLLARSDLDVQATIPLRLLLLVSLVGQNRMDVVSEKLKGIETSLRKQPDDFTLEWSFEGTKHFIGQHEAFNSSREWVLTLVNAFCGSTRETMLAGVEAAKARLVDPPSP